MTSIASKYSSCKESITPVDDASQQAYEFLKNFHLTHEGNANLLAADHADDLRYIPERKLWLIRDERDGIWKPGVHVMQLMSAANEHRRTAALAIQVDLGGVKDPDTLDPKTREIYETNERILKVKLENLAWCTQTENYNTAPKSVAWAETLPELMRKSDAWDQREFLLGTPGGIYDLTRGEIYDGEEAFISKSTAVAPADAADCPLWIDFLLKAMRFDCELVDYLNRDAGYSLTGSIQEHALVWFVGGGGNGKSTYLDAVVDIWGDYSQVLRSEVLIHSKHDGIPTEIADLKGRRLVIANEIEENRTWKMALLKVLTGGDAISARKLYENSIVFRPSHSLIISCNSQPSLDAVGDSERRRFQVLEWKQRFKRITDPTFEDGDIPVDLTFAEQLKSEYPMILRWAMDGALAWMQRGLDPPASILAASEQYLTREDSIGEWLESMTVVDPDGWEPSNILWTSWKSWCEANGQFPGRGAKGFIPKLLRRPGLRQAKSPCGNHRGVAGLRFRTAGEDGSGFTILRSNKVQ